MAHFACNRCGTIFSEDEAATESFRHTEVQPSFTENFLACPACLSTDYDDAAYCYKCGEPKRYKDLKGGYYCMDCLREITTTHQKNRYIRENIDDFADFIHAERAKFNADEQDERDRRHL